MPRMYISGPRQALLPMASAVRPAESRELCLSRRPIRGHGYWQLSHDAPQYSLRDFQLEAIFWRYADYGRDEARSYISGHFFSMPSPRAMFRPGDSSFQADCQLQINDDCIRR